VQLHSLDNLTLIYLNTPQICCVE